MTGKTGNSLAQKVAQNKACRKGSLYVYSRYSAVFGGNVRESTASAANDLAGNGKTIRAATVVAHRAALSMNESELRNAY